MHHTVHNKWPLVILLFKSIKVTFSCERSSVLGITTYMKSIFILVDRRYNHLITCWCHPYEEDVTKWKLTPRCFSWCDNYALNYTRNFLRQKRINDDLSRHYQIPCKQLKYAIWWPEVLHMINKEKYESSKSLSVYGHIW